MDNNSRRFGFAFVAVTLNLMPVGVYPDPHFPDLFLVRLAFHQAASLCKFCIKPPKFALYEPAYKEDQGNDKDLHQIDMLKPTWLHDGALPYRI
jgi:hypothetical protein